LARRAGVLAAGLAQCGLDRRATILHAAQHHRHLDTLGLGLLLPHGLAAPSARARPASSASVGRRTTKTSIR
jgi:hypothetical protein